jgi:sulfite exporter TauE/SafE
MSLPLGGQTTAGRIAGGLIYNAGRITTYTWLGLALGLVGDFLITPKVQSTLSIVFGAGILLYLLLPATTKKSLATKSPAQGFFITLRRQLGKLLSTPTAGSLFGIGLLNGLRPCGMIYLALTSSFLTGSAFNGGLFMASFGAGTLPAMLAVVFFGSYLSQQIRLNLRKTIPVFMACMAILLLFRGLNLGIPYLSPSLPQTSNGAEIICH